MQLLWLNLVENYFYINCICVKKIFWWTASLFRKYLLSWVQAKLLVGVLQPQVSGGDTPPQHPLYTQASVSPPQHQREHPDCDPGSEHQDWLHAGWSTWVSGQKHNFIVSLFKYKNCSGNGGFYKMSSPLLYSIISTVIYTISAFLIFSFLWLAKFSSSSDNLLRFNLMKFLNACGNKNYGVKNSTQNTTIPYSWETNDLTIGWQNPLSQPNATLAPQAS